MLCRGDEPQQLRQFKDALGMDNNAAAEVHMNVARQLMRERAEAGSRRGDTEQRKVTYTDAGDLSTLVISSEPGVLQIAGLDMCLHMFHLFCHCSTHCSKIATEVE